MSPVFFQKALLFSVIITVLTACQGQKKIMQNELPVKFRQQTARKTALEKMLTEKDWDTLFPNRAKIKKEQSEEKIDFYSYRAFITAASSFPEFLLGDKVTQRRELAAFLANIAQETSGGWLNAPGGYFKWGLHFINEQNNKNSYNDSTKTKYFVGAEKKYFGRGPLQLSWNYNYGQFSEYWFEDKEVLLNQPEMLSEKAILTFAASIWFWMTPQAGKPSCHDVITKKWTPSSDDLAAGRECGFGTIVNVINGGVECGKSTALQKTAFRYAYYSYFCQFLDVDPGNNISCEHQLPFGKH